MFKPKAAISSMALMIVIFFVLTWLTTPFFRWLLPQPTALDWLTQLIGSQTPPAEFLALLSSAIIALTLATLHYMRKLKSPL